MAFVDSLILKQPWGELIELIELTSVALMKIFSKPSNQPPSPPCPPLVAMTTLSGWDRSMIDARDHRGSDGIKVVVMATD